MLNLDGGMLTLDGGRVPTRGPYNLGIDCYCCMGAWCTVGRRRIMLKGIETEETIGFVVTFLSLVAF